MRHRPSSGIGVRYPAHCHPVEAAGPFSLFGGERLLDASLREPAAERLAGDQGAEVRRRDQLLDHGVRVGASRKLAAVDRPRDDRLGAGEARVPELPQRLVQVALGLRAGGGERVEEADELLVG